MNTSVQPAESTLTRRTDILTSVDRLIAIQDAWENDPNAPDLPTREFELALLATVDTCENGDVPASCRDLCQAMSRLRFEWNEYEDGTSRPDGTPVARFWSAFRAVIEARRGAEPFVPKRPEPVGELLRQNVSYQQIGEHIYGYHGQGPFIREDGLVDVGLIFKERDQPGSVVPKDWVHPAELERKAKWERETMTRIVAVNAREENEPTKKLDPAPIEDLLRQGQSVEVTARVKGVSEAEVLAVAKKFNIPVHGKEPTPSKPPAAAKKPAKKAKPEASEDVDGDADEGEDSEPTGTFSAEEVQAEVHARLDRGEGVPEIMAGLKDMGIAMTSKELAEIVRSKPVVTA